MGIYAIKVAAQIRVRVTALTGFITCSRVLARNAHSLRLPPLDFLLLTL